MAATMEKEYQEITISMEGSDGVRLNPSDMGKPEGVAVEVKRGEQVRVKRAIAAMLIANGQAIDGKVDLKPAKATK